MVGLAADGETLALALAPGVTPFSGYLPDAAPGTQAEICEAGRALAAAIGTRLRRDGGWALIIDYGYDSRHGVSLQAVRGHRGASILDRPGETDLSAHVDFAALGAVARQAGAAVLGPVAQGDFLRRLGIEHRAETLKKGATPVQHAAIDAALARLIAPDQMGTLFVSWPWATSLAPGRRFRKRQSARRLPASTACSTVFSPAAAASAPDCIPR
jgi:NADH dehydrogenase [ubiquinone] 1 alpha subcomplex assembly factor 7